MCADLLRGEEDLLPCGVDIGTRGQLDDRAIVGDVLQLALRKKKKKQGKKRKKHNQQRMGLGCDSPRSCRYRGIVDIWQRAAQQSWRGDGYRLFWRKTGDSLC